ncbi:MAG: Heparinase II/III-like protein [Pseudomonadota bacterium]|jgi:hypothetical protein
MANIVRVNFGDFVVFVNVFTSNAGALLAHNHDDLLSYVIYDKGHEILVDPGMPCYLKPNHFPYGCRHNGVWSAQSMLRPVARFFTPREFFANAIELDLKHDASCFYAVARNKYTKHERKLKIEGDALGIRVHEIYIPKPNKGNIGFTHCFADNTFAQVGARSVEFAGLKFEYSSQIVAAASDRVLAYGEPRRAHQINAQVANSEITWTMCRAG